MPHDAMHVFLPGQLRYSRHTQREVDRLCCGVSATPGGLFVTLMDELLGLLNEELEEEERKLNWGAPPWKGLFEEWAREGLLCRVCVGVLVRDGFMRWVVKRKIAGTCMVV